MSALTKLKKFLMRERVLDVIFLVGLIILYSAVAIFNLGDDTAPQTFYKLRPEEVIAIKLKKKVHEPKLIFYTGITQNDFELAQAWNENECTSNYLTHSDFKDFKNISISSIFILLSKILFVVIVQIYFFINIIHTKTPNLIEVPVVHFYLTTYIFAHERPTATSGNG